MVDPSAQFERACRELNPRWDAERSARVYAATVQLRQRSDARRTRAWACATFVVAALLGAGLQQLAGIGEPTATPAARARATPRAASTHTLRLADGSSAELLGATSEIEAVDNAPERVTLRLVAGRAHFDVVRNPQRKFVVEAPPYRVQVIGTVFDVERASGEVRVQVARGHVQVHGPAGIVDLRAGETRRFALGAEQVAAAVPENPAPQRAPPAAVQEPQEPQESRAAARPVRPRPRIASSEVTSQEPREADVPTASAPQSWRSLSRSGQYEAAFESLRKSEPVAEEPAALMDAADTARLSGHPESSVQYLSRVARGHARSPLAPLAAFTLGRVYLEELGQPDRAAEAFELSRRLAPSGSMAQDALAREVEALSKAGNARKAYVRAQEYLRRYPGGRRLRAVQLYGGLE